MDYLLLQLTRILVCLSLSQMHYITTATTSRNKERASPSPSLYILFPPSFLKQVHARRSVDAMLAQFWSVTDFSSIELKQSHHMDLLIHDIFSSTCSSVCIWCGRNNLPSVKVTIHVCRVHDEDDNTIFELQ